MLDEPNHLYAFGALHRPLFELSKQIEPVAREAMETELPEVSGVLTPRVRDRLAGERPNVSGGAPASFTVVLHHVAERAEGGERQFQIARGILDRGDRVVLRAHGRHAHPLPGPVHAARRVLLTVPDEGQAPGRPGVVDELGPGYPAVRTGHGDQAAGNRTAGQDLGAGVRGARRPGDRSGRCRRCGRARRCGGGHGPGAGERRRDRAMRQCPNPSAPQPSSPQSHPVPTPQTGPIRQGSVFVARGGRRQPVISARCPPAGRRADSERGFRISNPCPK